MLISVSCRRIHSLQLGVFGFRVPRPARSGPPGDRLETSHPLARKDISEVMARILVTGGLGTVGKVLVWTLNKRGHAVKVSGIEHHHEPDYVRCDVGSYMQLSRIFENEGFDFVYHLAAEFGRWNGEDYYDRLWVSNVVGTKNLVRMQEKYGFRLINFSSYEVYGD